MLKRLSDIDFLISGQRPPISPGEPARANFEGREEWYIIAQHRQKLIYLGVNLAAFEVESAIVGYPNNVEGAVLAFLERYSEPSISASRKLALLIRQGATPSNLPHTNLPRLGVCTASDFAPPLLAPTPAPRRSIPQLQADLDAGGVKAIATAATIRHNPQWGLEVVEGRIKALATEDEYFELQEIPF